ncbi:MAG: hypothetical protein AAFU55_08630, partial [Pseudomonadota bacterium]
MSVGALLLHSATRGSVLALAFAICLSAISSSAAVGQETGAADIIVVDKERVLRESDVARRLAEREGAARSALQQKLSQLTSEIEREEAELTTLRDEVGRAEFDERVRAFNEKVQAARRTFQQENE